MSSSSTSIEPNRIVNTLQDLIGTDVGGRGMKHLIVAGDLVKASSIFASLPTTTSSSHVLILSGFPCCMDHDPPTETDGPPGAFCLARTAVQLGYTAVTILTDSCNASVFQAAMDGWKSGDDDATVVADVVTLTCISTNPSPKERQQMQQLAESCGLILACERAGPAFDGNCYTMSGKNMTDRGLIAPLHEWMENMRSSSTDKTVPFLAIGDGGNELGMGKVLHAIREHIPKGEIIGCTIAADCLIAASVSNWGAYALAAGAAVFRAAMEMEEETTPPPDDDNDHNNNHVLEKWVHACVPTEQEEINLLERCVAAGCRDGISGEVEATVDGMPLETSMECLRSIRRTAMGM